MLCLFSLNLYFQYWKSWWRNLLSYSFHLLIFLYRRNLIYKYFTCLVIPIFIFLEFHISAYYQLLSNKIIHPICFRLLTISHKYTFFTSIIKLSPHLFRNMSIIQITKNFKMRNTRFHTTLGFLRDLIFHTAGW